MVQLDSQQKEEGESALNTDKALKSNICLESQNQKVFDGISFDMS